MGVHIPYELSVAPNALCQRPIHIYISQAPCGKPMIGPQGLWRTTPSLALPGTQENQAGSATSITQARDPCPRGRHRRTHKHLGLSVFRN